MIKRILASAVAASAKKYPIITITGPRQSGKTTLCRKIFSSLPYISLEDPDQQLLALEDPRGFLETFQKGAVLDEIQRAPKLTSYLQTLVDQPKNKRVFVLTGSQNLALSQTISQSLAGRTALFRLLPFSCEELSKKLEHNSLDRILYTGFYPRIHDKKLNPTQAMSAYYETYIERDIRALSNVHNLFLFQKFVKLCAGRVGQILNISSLGNEVGISAETARQWLSLLQATYVIYLAQPYYRNFNKRIIKSPRLYFYDIGLAAFLLGIHSAKIMQQHPLRGALFENFVFLDTLKFFYNQGLHNDLFFFRDSNGNEVDLIFEKDAKIFPVEIKSAKTLNRDFFKGLKYFQEICHEPTGSLGLVYSGAETTWEKTQVIHFRNLAQYIKGA